MTTARTRYLAFVQWAQGLLGQGSPQLPFEFCGQKRERDGWVWNRTGGDEYNRIFLDVTVDEYAVTVETHTGEHTITLVDESWAKIAQQVVALALADYIVATTEYEREVKEAEAIRNEDLEEVTRIHNDNAQSGLRVIVGGLQ